MLRDSTKLRLAFADWEVVLCQAGCSRHMHTHTYTLSASLCLLDFSPAMTVQLLNMCSKYEVEHWIFFINFLVALSLIG
jgi:hypothetical protein